MRLRAILDSLTRPATLGHSTHRFLAALAQQLPAAPTAEQFDAAVQETLARRHVHALEPGLRALARSAWRESIFAIEHYLEREAKAALDTDARDARNRDVRQALGAILDAELREGAKEITSADVVQAFALEHGLCAWRTLPERKPWKRRHRSRVPAPDVLQGHVQEALWRIGRTPIEVQLILCIACSLVIGAKVSLALTSWSIALTSVPALLGGWLAADFVGALYHWHMDNYAKGHTGFADHHREPQAVAGWPLRRNAQGTARPVTLLIAMATLLPGGPLAAFLLTLLNGVLYSEHAHGYSHAREADIPLAIRLLQSVPVLPILLPPEAHLRHHRPPLGKRAYGALNGWSNHITDRTGFFRSLEFVWELITGEKPIWQKLQDI